MTAPQAITGASEARAIPRWLLYVVGGLVVLLVLGLPTIIIPLATDQVLYSMGARTVLDGGQLYHDLWEIKPPLIYLVYAMPLALAGEHMEAVRVLDLINTFLAMGAVFLLTRRLFTERAASIAAVFYAFTYLTWARDGLAEAESFMAAPLVFALYLYVSSDRPNARPLLAGVFLGVAFALKSTAVLFAIGFPLSEFLVRDREGSSASDAVQRLALAAIGFLAVLGAVVAYMLATSSLDDFLDIQRHYTTDYNRYRYAPVGQTHARFVLSATAEWLQDVAFITVPAGIGAFFAFFRPRDARAVLLLTSMVALGVIGIWWQGKLFHYHWLIMIPLLAPLAGYGIDQVLDLLGGIPRAQQRLAVVALVAAIGALAFQQLIDTYDNYRLMADYISGSRDRREVEAHYEPLLVHNHQLVDYIKANGQPDDELFIWGLWPVSYWWLDRPLVDRFVGNHGLRSTWAPDSWRQELIDDLEANPPRYFAVAYGDRQPWLVGTAQTSDEHLTESFPQLRAFVLANYEPVLNLDLFLLYERRPAAVEAPPPQ